MAEDRITRKDLWQEMGDITSSDWCRVGRRLNLIVDTSAGKGSHAVIRDPRYPNSPDIRGHFTTIPRHLYKEMNRIIFKQILDFGIPEDDIWKALKML